MPVTYEANKKAWVLSEVFRRQIQKTSEIIKFQKLVGKPFFVSPEQCWSKQV
jgi:hypothetical protein